MFQAKIINRKNALNERSYVVNISDITERTRSEEILRKSEEKYRLLIENIYDIVYTLTADGVFTFVSPSWTTFLGHSVKEVEGQSFHKFVHPDDILCAWHSCKK